MILHMALLVCGDSSGEWTDPLQDGSVSGNDMNSIDLGSAVGATMYIKSDRGSVPFREGCVCFFLQTLKHKEMPQQIGDDTAFIACHILKGSFSWEV